MSSNYPPGVTGNEPQIAGYPEIEEEIECPNCGETNEVVGFVVSGSKFAYTISFTCPDCEYEWEEDEEYEPEPPEPEWY